MKQSQLFTILLMVSLFIAVSCNDYVQYEETPFYTDEELATITPVLNLPETPHSYQTFGGGFFGEFNNDLVATVGRVLFYDKDLSADGSISCASCHHQELAFSDNASLSEGVHKNLTTRNSIALGSLASFDEEYSDQGAGVPGLFWDERAPTVKAQMEQTFANPDEMGMDINKIADIVNAKPYYQSLFNVANFGFDREDHEINTENILIAIETFVRSVNSRQSKFDVTAGNNNAFFNEDLQREWKGFTDAENNGMHLFAEHCASCHASSVLGNGFSEFSPQSVANNGLDKVYTDEGVGEVTEIRTDIGKFKIPGLRNISLTAPYMHDGRFASLEEVIDFYSENIQAHENLDRKLIGVNGQPKKINFTDEEKSDLVAFFNTLTDEKMIVDPKWSDPFKK